MDHLLKTKREYKNLKRQEIQDIFIKKHEINPAFIIIWFMEILKIFLKEQFLINCHIIKQLILLKIQNVMDINLDLLQWFMVKSFLMLLLHVQLNLLIHGIISRSIIKSNYQKIWKTKNISFQDSICWLCKYVVKK